MSRSERRDALEAVRRLPQSAKEIFCELARCELQKAWNELETAQDEMGIWRAQGRALELRDLLSIMKKEG